MPWSVKKIDGKFCVVKEGESAAIKGGCHADRQEAVDHLQALYAAEAQYAVAESFVEDDVVEPDLSDEDIELAILEESPWSGYIAFEGVATGDNRSFASGAITWDELPLPLLYQKASTDGHGGSVVIGRVDEIERQKGGKVFARGVLLNTAEGNDYKSLLESGAAGGVSIDGDSAEYSVEEQEGKKPKVNFNSIRVRGLTAVAIPAFSDARIKLDVDATETDAVEEFCAEADCEGCHHDEQMSDAEMKKRKKLAYKKAMMVKWSVLTAAAPPIAPPRAWFQNPRLPGPTPQTILEDGQVFGHLALHGTCHIGMPKCTTPPRGGSYAYFHTGALETAEGEEISVGHLTFNTGHASIQDGAYSAAAHYDHTGTVAADVTVGEDEFGIWFAGALRPHLKDEDIRAFKAAPLSGDWRRIGSKMELVAALSVNTPGFPVPRTASRTRTRVLVAGGQDATFISTIDQNDYEAIGRQTYKDDLSLRVQSITQF